MKVCIKCQGEKPETEFYTRPDNGKTQNTCKACRIKYATNLQKNGKPPGPIPEDSHESKTCNCCGEIKPLNKFIQRPGRSGTHFNRCKDCKRQLEARRRLQSINKHKRMLKESDMRYFSPVLNF